jgi:Flp pilus assembly protein TadG
LSAPDTGRTDRGSVTFETILVLPFVMLAMLACLQVVGVVRDALLVHEAARAGVRAAATSQGTGAVAAAVHEALGGRSHEVSVTPATRQPGDLVTVVVRMETSLGPLRQDLSATVVAEVEPVVGR